MRVLKLHPTHPQIRLIRMAAEILRGGGVLAYPTDSCYALGCRIGDAEAAKRIRQLRGVDARHHLTLVCRDLAQVGRFARMDNRQFRILRQGTPGRFTFLLRATPEVPRRVQHPKRSTIGVRVPDHPAVLALLGELGEPILSSTLLLPGDPEPLNDAETIEARLGGCIEAIIDAGPCKAAPSTVIDLEVSPPIVVRLGIGDPAMLGINAEAAGLSTNKLLR
ncbi:MAG: L-threonylcarbamoyladenylate synthase [Burkholderiales bacterium]|jgi:tRNA threonylcarbamoyl adenosine modification protein (Sua5/YciO/YrdC/YwlC family)